MLRTYLASLVFLTRLPIPRICQCHDAAVFGRVPHAFAFVGLTIGLFGAIFGYGLSILFPVWLASVLLLGLHFLLTGCLHEDGLADVADAMGAWERTRRFEIMRDSTVGTYGMLALLVTSLLRLSCLSVLLVEPELLLIILPCAAALARWNAAMLMRLLPYLKNRAGGAGVAAGMERPSAGLLLLQALALLAGLACWDVFVALLFGVLTALCLCGAKCFYQRLFGGVTGDCLGAAIVLTECVLLIGMVGLAECYPLIFL